MSDELKRQVDVERQQLCRLLETRARLLAKCCADEPTVDELAALAAILHAFYNGVENIFRRGSAMTIRIVLFLASVLLIISPLTVLLAAEWYVAPPPLGNNKNPGTEAEPFATIQRGIHAATDDDTVIVARETYVENVNFDGKNIVLRGTDPTDWSMVKKTIIDGNKSGSVVTFLGPEDETCVLSGFTIRNGTGSLGTDAVLYGGGIRAVWEVAGTPRPTIRNNIITGNSAQGGGGISGTAGVIENCIITGNRAGTVSPNWCGGGMAFCNGIIQNNLIAGNVGPCGGAISFSNAVFRNNIVVGNAAPGNHGGGLAHLGTSPYTPPGGSITNCIIWGNTSPTGPQAHDSVAPSHCCIQDWTGGDAGNIALDPRFVDPDGPDDDRDTFEDNDYRLLPASACIDAGTNEDWMNGATDLDGNPRILLGALSLTADIGAYEHSFPIAIGRNATSDVELSWIMRPLRSYTVLSSPDMTAQPWVEETTISGGKSGGPAAWVDVAPTSTLKFYRIGIE